MRNLSDIIEQHLKQLLHQSAELVVEIQRNDLADQFECVPSQINYVISTRFTPEKGYIVESKRGGGGYVRIQHMQLPKSATIEEQLFVTIGDEIDQASAEGLVYQLRAAGHVTDREARIIAAAMARESLMVALPTRDAIRAKLLRAMLIAVLTSERKGGGVR